MGSVLFDGREQLDSRNSRNPNVFDEGIQIVPQLQKYRGNRGIDRGFHGFHDSLENSPRIGEIVFHSWNREFPPIRNAHEILDFLHVRDDFLQIENRTGLRVERYA